MTKIYQRLASEVQIQPVYAKGLKEHGLLFSVTTQATDTMGAQCAHCHTVLWFDYGKNKFLSEPYPEDVPDSGPGYKKYYEERMKGFFNSLPPCPVCGHKKYDILVDGATPIRFPDGAKVSDYKENYKGVTPVDPTTVKVWWYEDE